MTATIINTKAKKSLITFNNVKTVKLTTKSKYTKDYEITFQNKVKYNIVIKQEHEIIVK